MSSMMVVVFGANEHGTSDDTMSFPPGEVENPQLVGARMGGVEVVSGNKVVPRVADRIAWEKVPCGPVVPPQYLSGVCVR